MRKRDQPTFGGCLFIVAVLVFLIGLLVPFATIAH